ncbi:MAG: dihydroxyacetone kinase subunit L [Pseudomonadota bacterium]
MSGFTAADLAAAAARIAPVAAASADELNALDGQLGDGDLGITVSKGWAEAAAAELPADLGQAFLALAKAFQRASSSSFGTLVATGFMAAAKATKGREEAGWDEVGALLSAARDAMMARGKGALGDKSVLDVLDAAAEAASGKAEPGAILSAVDQATDQALEAFRDRPNRLGRARMFGERSQGLDDPGMRAFRRILDGLVADR